MRELVLLAKGQSSEIDTAILVLSVVAFLGTVLGVALPLGSFRGHRWTLAVTAGVATLTGVGFVIGSALPVLLVIQALGLAWTTVLVVSMANRHRQLATSVVTTLASIPSILLLIASKNATSGRIIFAFAVGTTIQVACLAMLVRRPLRPAFHDSTISGSLTVVFAALFQGQMLMSRLVSIGMHPGVATEANVTNGMVVAAGIILAGPFATRALASVPLGVSINRIIIISAAAAGLGMLVISSTLLIDDARFVDLGVPATFLGLRSWLLVLLISLPAFCYVWIATRTRDASYLRVFSWLILGSLMLHAGLAALARFVKLPDESVALAGVIALWVLAISVRAYWIRVGGHPSEQGPPLTEGDEGIAPYAIHD